MNGQHLRSLPQKELTNLIGDRWKSAGILKVSEGPFVDVRFYDSCLPFHTVKRFILSRLSNLENDQK